MMVVSARQAADHAAFTSAVPFLLAFSASALHRIRASAATRWLMANRRYLGLSVAASHFVPSACSIVHRSADSATA